MGKYKLALVDFNDQRNSLNLWHVQVKRDEMIAGAYAGSFFWAKQGAKGHWKKRNRIRKKMAKAERIRKANGL